MTLPSLAILVLAFAHADSGPDNGRKEQIKREIRAQQAEAEPEIRELNRLSQRYGGISDLGAIEPERSRLRGKLQERKETIDALKSQFRSAMGLEYLSALPDVVGAKGKARGVDAMMQRGIADDGYYHNITDAGAVAELDEDETLFQIARKEQERRRFRRGAALSLGIPIASAALACGLWAARKRRRGRTPAALPAPAGPPLSGPAASGAAFAPGASAAENALLAGAELGGNFRITRELGRGGVGLVYEAVDLSLNRKVAIKKLREEFSGSPRELKAFLAEARAVASLRHPNVAEIHAVLREGGQVYLVFEYVEGRALDRLLEERGRLPLAAVQGILAQVAAALGFAHAREVLHRDLKPSNVLVTPEGIAKVTDFGLARRAKTTSARLSGNAGCATDPYMAPEQELGASSRESDLYSLGACVYEMAVGRAPFPGPDYLAQKRAMRYDPPSEAAGLPPRFDALIRKALQPDPKKRFQSAPELLAAATALEGSA